jgi:MshEN domain
MEINPLLGMKIPQSVIEMVPESVARENCLLPISFENRRLRIALADLNEIDTLEKLAFILKWEIEPLSYDRKAILGAINLIRSFAASMRWRVVPIVTSPRNRRPNSSDC